MDQATYNKMQQKLAQTFGINVENWNGKMWALFAFNLDYYAYVANH